MQLEIFPLRGFEIPYLNLMDACEKVIFCLFCLEFYFLQDILVARTNGYEIVFTTPSQNHSLYPHCKDGRYLRVKCLERPLKV